VIPDENIEFQGKIDHQTLAMEILSNEKTHDKLMTNRFYLLKSNFNLFFLNFKRLDLFNLT
jgi:hypothetical protein